MRRSSLYTSAAFHLLLMVLAIMGLPFLSHHEIDTPQPIMVDLVQISEISQTNKVAPPVPKPPEPKPPEPQKPQPAPPPPPTPPQPVPEPPKPEPPKVTPPVTQVDENAPPKKEEVKKVVKKPPPPKKQVVQRDLASVLKDLDVNKKPAPTPEPAQQAPVGEKLTMSEEDALKSQLQQCWDVPIGAKGVETMSVNISMVINEDRTLREVHIDDMARYNSDPVFQALADSAVRAVQRCSPFQLPPDKYTTWNKTTVTLSPKDMF